MYFGFDSAVRFSYRISLKPWTEVYDYFRKVTPETQRAVDNARFQASLLRIAYDYYELEGKDADCIRSWKDLGYEQIDSSEFSDVSVRELVQSQKREVVPLRKIRAKSSVDHSQSNSDEPEDIVVLFRGTCLKTIWDVLADLQIIFEVLHKTERVRDSERLVKELVDQQLRRYGRQRIRLVGHSLGAAIAFIIARRLHLENPTQTPEGHFFNLPYMDLETLYMKLLRMFVIDHAALGFASDILHRNPHFQEALRALTGLVARMVVSKKTVQEVDSEFAKLKSFKPNIYVNGYDMISNGYLTFFRNSALGNGSFGMTRYTAILSMVGFGFKSLHLCPSANLMISWKGFCTLTSHSIDNWTNLNAKCIRLEKYTSFVRDDGERSGEMSTGEQLQADERRGEMASRWFINERAQADERRGEMASRWSIEERARADERRGEMAGRWSTREWAQASEQRWIASSLPPSTLYYQALDTENRRR